MTIEEYILYRIETLRKAKKNIIKQSNMNGAKNTLLEINTRLAELESIALRLNLKIKDFDAWAEEVKD